MSSPLKKIVSVFTLFLFVAVLVAGVFMVYRQVTLRSKASGTGVTLTMAASPTTVTAGNNFDIAVNLTVDQNATNKLTAASVVATYDSNKLTLVSVTPGAFFKPSNFAISNMEMLALGTSCSDKSHCLTTASGVNCTSGLCVNSSFTGNTAGSVKFSIGVPCDVTHMGCLNNACAVLAGSGSDTCTLDSQCATNAGSGTAGKCYPPTATAGQVAVIRFQAKSTASGNAAIAFDTTNTIVTGIDVATGEAINSSLLDSATGTSVNITGGTDTTAPTVSLTDPAAGNVSGTVTMTATAADAVGVTRVDFLVDGTVVNSDTTSPYSYAWNTTTATNAVHSLTAKAYDAANNVGTSTAVSVTVNNTTTAPTLTFGYKLSGNTTAAHTRSAVVTIKNTAQTLSSNVTLSVSTSGLATPTTPITLTGITVNQSYSVLVKATGYLQKNLGTITIAAGANSGPTAWNSISPAGVDFNSDNNQNGTDMARILSVYTQISTPVTTSNAVYDLNGDGNITASDVAKALSYYTVISVLGDN